MDEHHRARMRAAWTKAVAGLERDVQIVRRLFYPLAAMLGVAALSGLFGFDERTGTALAAAAGIAVAVMDERKYERS